MTSSSNISTPFPDDGQPIAAGGPSGSGPTPEELVHFERVMAAARAKFMAAAMAEDGMPISAGWRGPEVEPNASLPADRTLAPGLDQVAPHE